jgi:hypothetical protein
MQADRSERPAAEARRPEKILNPDSLHAASKDRAPRKRTRRKNMNRYQISSPRKAFAIVSVAMTAITIGLAVIVPAKMQSEAGELRTLATITVTSPSAEVAPQRLHVDVVGIREPEFAAVQVRTALPPKRKQNS